MKPSRPERDHSVRTSGQRGRPLGRKVVPGTSSTAGGGGKRPPHGGSHYEHDNSNEIGVDGEHDGGRIGRCRGMQQQLLAGGARLGRRNHARRGGARRWNGHIVSRCASGSDDIHRGRYGRQHRRRERRRRERRGRKRRYREHRCRERGRQQRQRLRRPHAADFAQLANLETRPLNGFARASASDPAIPSVPTCVRRSPPPRLLSEPSRARLA
jgi:hypothetical protein